MSRKGAMARNAQETGANCILTIICYFVLLLSCCVVLPQLIKGSICAGKGASKPGKGEV